MRRAVSFSVSERVTIAPGGADRNGAWQQLGNSDVALPCGAPAATCAAGDTGFQGFSGPRFRESKGPL